MRNETQIRKLERELSRVTYGTWFNVLIVIFTAAFYAPALMIVIPLIALSAISVWFKIQKIEGKIDKLSEVSSCN